MHRVTPELAINYYVDPADVDNWSMRNLRALDRKAEVEFVKELRTKCENEVGTQNQIIQEATGWFSVDQDMVNRARKMELRSCARLQSMGIPRKSM